MSIQNQVSEITGINKIQSLFNHKSPYIAYLTCGHPRLSETVSAAEALVEGGVDLLEIGMPFSDPVADGPVIQAAMKSALSGGVTLEDVLNTVQKIKKKKDVPIVLFSYYNPLLAYGIDRLAKAAQKAGVDAFLIVDAPFEVLDSVQSTFEKEGVGLVYLIAPSTKVQRIQKIAEKCNTFLYYVCRNGTTGVKMNLPENYIEKITTIKSLTHKSVVVGFGISNREMAGNALRWCNGFVVGSAFVAALESGITPQVLQQLTESIDPRGLL